MDTQLFLKLASGLITIIIALVSYFVIPWIKNKVGIEKWNFISDKVEKAVRAAKQLFSDSPEDNEKKKEYVVNYVTKVVNNMNINVTSEDMEVLIEGIYENIKNNG